MRAYSLLPLVSLFACTPSGGDSTLERVFDPCELLVIVIADDATPSVAADVDAAIAMWRRVGNYSFTRQPIAGAATLPIWFEPAAQMFHGIYLDEVGEIVINTELPEGHGRAVTMAHEIGHALGLWHAGGNVSSVMRRGNLEIEPTETDAQSLTELWGSCEVSRQSSVVSRQSSVIR